MNSSAVRHADPGDAPALDLVAARAARMQERAARICPPIPGTERRP
ncbi:MAG: hypothetical protein ACK5MQ_11355 [Pikeienuella sp.]